MYYVFIYVLILVSLDPISYNVWCARNSYKAFITTKIQRNNDQKKNRKKNIGQKKMVDYKIQDSTRLAIFISWHLVIERWIVKETTLNFLATEQNV